LNRGDQGNFKTSIIDQLCKLNGRMNFRGC
jgi:hypothetical protein